MQIFEEDYTLEKYVCKLFASRKIVWNYDGLQIIIIIIIIIYSDFFISVLADGLSLEFQWQQVSSSLQDASQYSGRSQ